VLVPVYAHEAPTSVAAIPPIERRELAVAAGRGLAHLTVEGAVTALAEVAPAKAA
jgi:hypothetical protein